MSDLAITRRRFKIRLLEKQDTSDAIPALLGKGNGDVEILNQPGQVYIRVGNQENFGTAFNNRVPNSDNLPIFVGYDPITDIDRRLFQVLSIRQTAYVDAGNTPIPQIGPHHTTHEFGGGDDVYIEWRRLMGLRVGRPSAFVVTVDWGYICRAGIWIQAPVGVNTVDLTAEQAALVGTQAQLILISLDANGAIEQTNGAIKASPLALTISDCPTPPAGNIPLAAVRIYATQTTIGDTPTSPDILDLRFPTYNAMNNGGVAGNDTEIQYNNGGVFGADSDFAWDDSNKSLLVGSAHGIGALGNNSIVNTGEGHSASFASVIYGTNNPAFAGFHARGTLAIPTKALSGDYLLTVGGRGYATAGWESGARGSFNIIAAEDHDTTHGTYATIRTTPIGGIATQDVARFDNASGIINYATNLYTTKDFILTAEITGAVIVRSATPNIVGGAFGATPGNARGIGAVDLQMERGVTATRVASGNYSVVIGGSNNTASGTNSIVGGDNCTASGVRSLALGNGARASGDDSICIGSQSQATATGSAAIGSYATATGAFSFALGGSGNTSEGDYAVSMGRQSKIAAAHDGSFLFSDHTFADFNSIAADEFAIRVANGLRVACDDGSYFTAKVADTTGVTTFAGVGSTPGFVFTHTVTFTAAPIFSTMTAGWLPYMGASKEIVGSANATLDSSGNAYFAGNVGIRKTAPGAPLDVFGDIWVGNQGPAANRGLYIGNAGYQASILYNNSTGDLEITPRNGYKTIFTAGDVVVVGAFGCNGAAAQAAYAVGAAATDAATTMALVNLIRTALLNNGIAKVS